MADENPQISEETPKTENKPKKQRRGFRSTEFWLSFLTAGLGLAIMGGWVNVEESVTTADKIAGLVVAALASMGYSVSRGLAKQGKDTTK